MVQTRSVYCCYGSDTLVNYILVDGEEEGQGPRDKKGVGYHGEKIVFAPAKPRPAPRQPPPPPGHRISSAYSTPAELDPPERLERTNPPLYLKFREHPIKFYSAGTIGGEKEKK